MAPSRGLQAPAAPAAVVQVSDVQYLGLEPVLYAQFKYLPRFLGM